MLDALLTLFRLIVPLDAFPPPGGDPPCSNCSGGGGGGGW
jgi:hypothetical protein